MILERNTTFDLSDGGGLRTEFRYRKALLIIALFFVVIAAGAFCLYRYDKYVKIQDQVPSGNVRAAFAAFIFGYITPQNQTERLDFIRNMTRSSWNAYANHAWGKRALAPIGKTSPADELTDTYSYGVTLVESLSTLWVMDLKDEFNRGREWVAKLEVPKNTPLYVWPLVTRHIGSLLSCFALTGDSMFLEKAREIGDVIKPAFNTTDKPYNMINKKFKLGKMGFIGEIGGMHLELKYLDALSNDFYWRPVIEQLRRTLKQDSGLYHLYISNDSYWQYWESLSLQRDASPFFSYLVKAYLQSDGEDTEALAMFEKAIATAEKYRLINKTTDGLAFLQNYHEFNKIHDGIMQVEGCGYGAYLALEGSSKNLKLAKNITETCYLMTNRTKTRLPPKDMNIGNKTRQISKSGSLSPELAESYFTLFRLTEDNQYRDHAWELAQAINSSCRTPSGGFTELYDVNDVNSGKQADHQPPEFLGATLKYLFLSFTDLTILPLDSWVFNAVGQPLPICGQNEAYMKCN